MVSYNCESATIELSKDSAIKAAATVVVAQVAKIDQTTMEVPEQKRTSTALDPSPTVKKVCLGLPDASKEVVIGANLNPKYELALTSFLRDNADIFVWSSSDMPGVLGSWLSTHLKSTRLHNLSSKSFGDLRKIESKP
jgi:hypothetical protein